MIVLNSGRRSVSEGFDQSHPGYAGATKEAHARENTGAMSFRLSREDVERLDQVSTVFK